MSDLRQLYQELIIDHGRAPRNFGKLTDATFHQEGFNPLCGDRIDLYIKEKNGVLSDICFEGSGCAISMASASLLTESLKNKTIDEAKIIYTAFHRLLTEKMTSDQLGKLTALAGVADYPSRIKCATLAWHTLKAALNQEMTIVTTE